MNLSSAEFTKRVLVVRTKKKKKVCSPSFSRLLKTCADWIFVWPLQKKKKIVTDPWTKVPLTTFVT